MRQLRDKIREVGFIYAVKLAAERLTPAWVFRITPLVILALSTSGRGSAAPEAGITFGWGHSQDVELLTGFGHPRAMLNRRLERGDRVALLAREGELLAYTWFQAARYEEETTSTRFAIAPDSVWLYDAMVARAARGSGTYAGLLERAAAELGREGFVRVWIAVDGWNRNSLVAHQRAGAQEACRIGVLQLLGWKWIWGHRPGGVPRIARGWIDFPLDDSPPRLAAVPDTRGEASDRLN